LIFPFLARMLERHGCCGGLRPLQSRFHAEMVFLANLGVQLHVRLCGGLQAYSTQVLDFLGIDQTGTRREAVGLSARSV